MRIGITTRSMDNRITGIGNYVYNIVRELKSSPSMEYILIHSKKSDNEWYKEFEELIIPRIPIIPYAINSSIALSMKKDFDTVHETENMGIMFPSKFRKILTIHSLYTYLYPATVPVSWRLKMLVAKRFYPYHDIDKIITVSKTLKNEIMSVLNIPEEKIKVIYHGVDKNLFKRMEIDDNLTKEIREKYKLDTNFILSVTTLQPIKNIPVLLKAFYIFKKKYGLNQKLVIVGGKGWKYSEIYDLVRNLNIEKEVIFTGHVLNKELPIIYNLADLFVFPSLYEGFGIPLLEAMACGCPVITSNISSMPEVVGDAGMLVNPYDVNKLADAMAKILLNDDVRNDFINNGLERVCKFSWKNAAKETLEVYKHI